MKRRLLRFSGLLLLISAVCFALDYLFFHFVTDEGITLVWHAEAGKPFVTLLIGILATLFLFVGALSALAALVLFAQNENQEENTHGKL